MARNTTITRDAVFATADELAEQLGKAPTQAQVRDALGGGSFTTIGPHMKEWEAARAERTEARETQVPDAVQAALAEVAGRLWQVASSEAALGVEAARREVEDMRKDAAAEAAVSAEAIQIVEGERDAALGQVEALTGDLKGVRAELVRVQTDLRGQIEARTRAEGQVEAAKDMIRAHEKEMAGLYERLTQAEARVSELGDAKGRAELAASSVKHELIAAKARTADLEAALAKAEARADRAETKRDEVQAELAKASTDLGSARADLAKERAEHGATRSQLSERLERLSVDLEQEQDRVKALGAELAEARKVENRK